MPCIKRIHQLISKDNLKTYCQYPIKALCSGRFYFDVLFKLKGMGLAYLFIISLVLSIPATIKVNAVLNTFKSIELPSLVASIPPSYLSDDGVLTPKNSSDAYKEIKTSKGMLAIVYNVDDKNIASTENPIVELNSKTIAVKSGGKDTVVAYTDLFEKGSDFNPVEAASLVDAVFGVAKTVMYFFIAGWFFFILAFNALVIAVLSKAIFLFVGKMKTSFVNVLRMSSFANTIVGVVLAIEFFINIKLSYGLVCLLPMVYMGLFIKVFRSEIENNGIENFVKKFTPEGTRVRNYGSEESNEKKDLSEYTSGLDSTSNRKSSEDNIGADANTSIKDSSQNNNSDKDNGSSDDEKGGPGFFAP